MLFILINYLALKKELLSNAVGASASIVARDKKIRKIVQESLGESFPNLTAKDSVN